MVFNSQANKEAEQHEKTVATLLAYFFAQQRKEWGIFVRPFKYAYNMQIN